MVYILVEVNFCFAICQRMHGDSLSQLNPLLFMPPECNSRESSFVLSVCVPFCLCVSVCLLPNFFNLGHKF